MSETIGEHLLALRRRAGMTLTDVAKAAGYAGPSSAQKYFNRDFDEPLGLIVANRMADALAGKGDPEIVREDIFRLCGPGADSVVRSPRTGPIKARVTTTIEIEADALPDVVIVNGVRFVPASANGQRARKEATE